MITPQAAEGEPPRPNLDGAEGGNSGTPSPNVSVHSGSWWSCISNAPSAFGRERPLPPSESNRGAAALADPPGAGPPAASAPNIEAVVAARGVDLVSPGGTLVPAAVVAPFVPSEGQSNRGSRKACAKRPVATVSIATRRFWLRFENDDIEAM